MSSAETPPEGFTFHHLGYATRSIDREYAVLSRAGYAAESLDFEDPTQGVRGRFVVGAGPRIELLENLPGRATLDPFLDAGTKLYHLAYELDAIDDGLAWAREGRARVTVEPVPAVAFGGRLIAFVIFRNGLLIELIERARERP